MGTSHLDKRAQKTRKLHVIAEQLAGFLLVELFR